MQKFQTVVHAIATVQIEEVMTSGLLSKATELLHSALTRDMSSMKAVCIIVPDEDLFDGNMFQMFSFSLPNCKRIDECA